MEKIKIHKTEDIKYQFTAIPTNLFLCMDLNCRSMLFTLIQLSTYYADSNGYFFRTNSDLQEESKLSENVIRATLSSLYSHELINVKTVGAKNGKTPNFFKVEFDKFVEWEKYDIEDCMKNPMYLIETDNYKTKGWKASYMISRTETKDIEQQPFKESVEQLSQPTLSTSPQQSEYNIDNIENKNNKNNKLNTEKKAETNRDIASNNKQIVQPPTAYSMYTGHIDKIATELYNSDGVTMYKTNLNKMNNLIENINSDLVLTDKQKQALVGIAEKRKNGIIKCKEKFFIRIAKQPKNLDNPLLNEFRTAEMLNKYSTNVQAEKEYLTDTEDNRKAFYEKYNVSDVRVYEKFKDEVKTDWQKKIHNECCAAQFMSDFMIK